MKNFITTKQVADKLNCNVRRVYYLKQIGALKPTKIGDMYLYDSNEVNQVKTEKLKRDGESNI